MTDRELTDKILGKLQEHAGTVAHELNADLVLVVAVQGENAAAAFAERQLGGDLEARRAVIRSLREFADASEQQIAELEHGG